MKNLIITFFIIIFTLPLGAQVTWTEDWEAAQNQAKREGKDLLINFTGSDWCVWCKKLDAEVFSKAEYSREASTKYIHVKLDFPQRLPQTPAIKARNRQLAERFLVEGYPTILLADANLRVFGRTGYQEGGPGGYLSHLTQFQTRKAFLFSQLNRATSLSGVEKARQLDRFLTDAEAAGLEQYYSELPLEIIRLDSGGTAGLRPKYEIRAQLNTLLSGLTEDSDFAKTEGDLMALESKAGNLPGVRQEVMYFRALVILNGLNQPARAKALLQEVQKVDPTSRIGQAIPRVLSQIP